MTPGVEFAETVLTLGGVVLAVVVVAGLALRRVWRRQGGEGAALVELDERLGTLEEGEGRLAELEERLDFAERMLATRSGSGAVRAGEEH